MSFSGGTDTGTGSSQTSDAFTNSADNVANSFSTAAIVTSIIGGIVTIVVVVLIIRCLQKTKLPIVRFNTPPPITYSYPLGSPTPAIQKDVAGGETILRFINDIAKEKPMRFSPQELAYFTGNYSTLLGSGGFGMVYKGKFSDGVPIAVKVLNKSLDKRAEEQFMAEVGTMARTYHINLVRLYGFCFDREVKALVYEYMENGSLDKHLFDGDHRSSITWSKLYDIAVGTAKGIAYLHEECQQRITHYDIKPGNVLLDANFCPKVADFGLAKLCDRDATHVTPTGMRGTPGYAAPELYMPFPITHKCDVYSFGILLFEILGRRRSHDLKVAESCKQWLPRWAWERFEKGELLQMIEELQIEDDGSKEKAMRMCKIALWCVQYLPGDRPPMSFVVRLLDGERDFDEPPNPFKHLGSGTSNLFVLRPWSESDDGSNGVTSRNKSDEVGHCSDTTPIMKKHGISRARD